MKPALSLLLVPVLALPAFAQKWSAIPKEVWEMKNNPELVAQGAVILERKLDFQSFYFEQTLRVRILSQAGVAAAEITDMPPLVLFLDGQVTFPDGRTQPITKRENFLVRKVVSSSDGTINEGVLIPSGLTSDCVLELRWKEASVRGRANQLRSALLDYGNLPERCGDFWSWTLAGAYPTQTCIVRVSKEANWPMLMIGASGFGRQQGADALGTTFTFRDLPALPTVPYSTEANRPSPKVVFYRPIEALRNLEVNVPSQAYWQRTVDFYFKAWFEKFVSKYAAYKAFSEEVRKNLTGGPHEKARLIAERVAKRIVNLDHLLFDEKPPLLARNQQELGGVSNLEFAVKAGYADQTALVKLLYHVLQDEGFRPKVALVADKQQWKLNPEVRTPFQVSHTLLGVDEPNQPTLWLDPATRLVPAGQLPPKYQGTRAVVIDSATWQASFQDIRPSPMEENAWTSSFRLAAGDEHFQVQVDHSLQGAPALSARTRLGGQAPTQRGTWFKERLEARGLSVSSVAVANDLDLAKPLTFKAEGSLPLEAGRLLKLNPFPGMEAGLYLPDSLPEGRRDAIVMPYKSLQTAVSIIQVPKGYRLTEPIEVHHSNRWGEVHLTASQDSDTGELTARMQVQTMAVLDSPAGYGPLKDFLQWVRAAVQPSITLEKAGEPGS